MKSLHTLTFVLLVIGGLNWGLAVFDYDIAKFIDSVFVTKIIYALVGIAALVEIFTHKNNCKCCDGVCEPKNSRKILFIF